MAADSLEVTGTSDVIDLGLDKLGRTRVLLGHRRFFVTV